jgi:outer membrane protein assembly factor BamB
MTFGRSLLWTLWGLLAPGALLAAENSLMAVSPWLRFTAPDTACVVWESEGAGTGALAFGKTADLGTVVKAESEGGLVHTAWLRGLEPGQDYHYRVATTVEGKRQLSPAYTFSNVLNFSVAPVKETEGNAAAKKRAQEILRATGVRKGFAVALGWGEPEELVALAEASELVIYAVESASERIQRLRQALYERGVYGTRVSVMTVASLEEVPVTPCLANILLAADPEDAAKEARLMDLVVPGRGKVLFEAEASEATRVVTRPPLEGIGEWTHQYGDAANTANSGETLSGTRSTEDLTVQWVGRPGGDFGIDRNPRMPAPVASNGRLFHQGMNRVAALDAYNGTILWSAEIPDLRRVNIPRDSSNWCVDERHLFMAVRDRAWIHEAATGDRVATVPVPESGGGEDHYWGYIAQQDGYLFGSGVRPEAIYERYWGGEAWYDANKAGGLGTAKVCSDQVFAYEVDSRRLAWSYENGVILNPTIAVGEGQVVFIECRHPKILEDANRQISAPELWLDQYLVALDARTGAKRFERSLDITDGSVSIYLQLTEEGILVTTSNKEFHLQLFDTKTGESRWENQNPWPDDHHSGHIQHPVVVNDTIYLQPNGYSLKTGEVVTTNVGARSGCHTYVGASDCLIYRGENRQIAVWDQEDEKVTSWTRLRPSCWLSVVPSNGMLLVPEGGAGCSCGGWIETSLVFAPKKVVGYPAKPKP